MLVLPALMITLGGTESEAQAKAQLLEDLASPEFRWQNVLYTAGLDPDAFDPDAPLPADLWKGQPAPSSRAEQLYATARGRPEASLREITRELKSGAGQFHFVGTPEQLADHVIAWQDADAVDGFTIMGSTLPYELTAFVDHVVPILQRKGRALRSPGPRTAATPVRAPSRTTTPTRRRTPPRRTAGRVAVTRST